MLVRYERCYECGRDLLLHVYFVICHLVLFIRHTNTDEGFVASCCFFLLQGLVSYRCCILIDQPSTSDDVTDEIVYLVRHSTARIAPHERALG